MSLTDLGLPDDDATLRRLSARLGQAAAEADLLDVAYRTIDSPLGTLLLAATPRGLVRVAFSIEATDEVLGELASRVSPRVLEDRPRLDPVARELGEYFEGRRRSFDVPVDLSLAAGFRREVVELLPRIAYGSTASYRQVAEMIGNPGATRAVGTACARNPVPLVLPCHRVVRADGATGAYRGGPEAKIALLALEKASGPAPAV
ncbi:methylated-DNA--[protein]-cysteine S-methyltransferase [Pseudactinotalea terrae]|uniref:methylated-DNA--[protein]-cysteine S-methyltransferase n=1 Tax=Pseudactinotalea terrae TaxID=1743262 RepID=UPI0012E2FEC3|nr:methylated-DNA--[protein]-cysteine S-methyltransferase [Pseudactinotalea terrae]